MTTLIPKRATMAPNEKAGFHAPRSSASTDREVFWQILLRGVAAESTEKPSRLSVAAIDTCENELVDYGQSVRVEPNQEPQPPSVVTALMERASQLGKFKKGWNSYSAPAPMAAVIDNGKTLVTLAAASGIIPERIEPSAMGGIGITFTAGSREVAVEFYNAGNAHALFSDNDTETLDTTPVALDVEGYNKLLQQVRRYLYGHNAAL